MRLVFLGSPPFALPILEHVLASKHELRLLVTQPDRPSGRGRVVQRSGLVLAAEGYGIPVVQPETTRSGEFLVRLAEAEPEILLVASYGEILREDVLALAPQGALNVHASLLPRWRGASPIQAAILAGDERTGVSIQRMVRALDAGDVLLEESTPIGPDETAGELMARLAQLGGEAAVRALDLCEAGLAHFRPQDPARVTHARKLAKEDGRIDWSRPAEELARLVRALNPWPLARSALPDGRELAVLRARALPLAAEAGLEPGTLLSARELLVGCGEGTLELLQVQAAGRPAMEGAAFLRGSRLPALTRFGGPRPG